MIMVMFAKQKIMNVIKTYLVVLRPFDRLKREFEFKIFGFLTFIYEIFANWVI